MNFDTMRKFIFSDNKSEMLPANSKYFRRNLTKFAELCIQENSAVFTCISIDW